MTDSGKADAWFESAESWRTELLTLRDIVLSTGLEESLKWGVPCYTLDGKNVVAIAAFKSYFGLWFFQGAFLEDKRGVLVNAQEGRTKGQRQWRFDGSEPIPARVVKSYVNQAANNAKEGNEIKPQRQTKVDVPPELEAALRAKPKAAKAFAALTPGRQREYAQYVAEAKRDETKAKRIEKILPMIGAGVGLNDKYR